MKATAWFLVAVTLPFLPCAGSADGGSVRVLTAHSGLHARRPAWLPDSLEAVYQYDDGTAETGIVPLLNNNAVAQPEAIFLEQFDVIPGQNVIDSIAVAWGCETGSRPGGLNGYPVTLGIWSDPDNDGQPYDAVLRGWVDGVVSLADTDTFVTYKFNHPVTIPEGGPTSFFLGFKTPGLPHGLADNRGHFFAGIDSTFSAGKGWMIWNDTDPTVRIKFLGNNVFVFRLEDIYGPGNFMIRSGF